MKKSAPAAGVSGISSLDLPTRDLLNWLARLRDQAMTTGLSGDDLAEVGRRTNQLLSISRAALSRYGGIFDAAPDAITLIDRDGHILDANYAAESLFGWTLSELKQRSIFDLNPSLPTNYFHEIWDQLELDQTISIQTTNRRADGVSLSVEVHSRAYLENGEKRVVAVARDIGERLRAELKLSTSEARYSALFAAVDKGVLLHDEHGQVRSINAAARRILGLDSDELTIRSSLASWDLFDAEGQPIAWSQNPVARAVRLTERIDSTEIGLVHRTTGVGRWISISVVPQIRDGESKPFQYISLFSDITDLKRASELFDEVQLLARIGGWTIDLKGQSLYWTDALHRMLGREPSDALAPDSLIQMLHPAERVRMQAALERAARDGTPIDIEARVFPTARRLMWVRVLGHAQSRHGIPYQLTGTIQEITGRKLEEDRLRRQAQVDPLTGLWNRDAALTMLSTAIGHADLHPGPALLYVDLDRFKVINDLLGHTAGDRLLTAAAKRLSDGLPSGAQAARFGGDEFLVLVADAPSDEYVWQLAERIGSNFSTPFNHAGEDFVITPSIGIARYPNDGLTVQALLNHADVAMAEAKRRGRNTWQMFSPALALQLKEQLLIETQLRRAIENCEFHLVYQPKVDMVDGRVIGAEALLRWHSRVLGDLSPEVFIPIAETSGDIVRIGSYVLEQACKQLRDWRALGLDLGHVAVNVSFRQFLGDHFERSVRRVLESTGLPPEALHLEMTERALMEDAPATEQTLASLRRLGIAISIDDFGEGYSALGYLRRLPIAGIKISHHFMHGVPSNPTDAKLCEAILQMARALDLSVVVEGVERTDQRDFLLSLGARYAQGYFFSGPLSADDFERFARGRT